MARFTAVSHPMFSSPSKVEFPVKSSPGHVAGGDVLEALVGDDIDVAPKIVVIEFGKEMRDADVSRQARFDRANKKTLKLNKGINRIAVAI